MKIRMCGDSLDVAINAINVVYYMRKHLRFQCTCFCSLLNTMICGVKISLGMNNYLLVNILYY